MTTHAMSPPVSFSGRHQRQIGKDPDLQLLPGPRDGPPYQHDGARRQGLPVGGGPVERDELLAAGILRSGGAHGAAGRGQPGGTMSMATDGEETF